MRCEISPTKKQFMFNYISLGAHCLGHTVLLIKLNKSGHKNAIRMSSVLLQV